MSKMQIDAGSGSRKKTMALEEFKDEPLSQNKPNIITNVEQEFKWSNPKPVMVEKITLQDVETHAKTKSELYGLMKNQGELIRIV